MIGEKVLHYRVEALIGEGGMATVYRGRDEKLGRSVAIKVLHAHFARDEKIRARFESEAKVQAQLNHPNIVSVFDYHFEGDHLCIIMEHVEGKSLAEVIAEETGPMSLSACLEIMRQVLRAVGYANAHGVVHRDLKPSNILIQRLEGQTVAKVMDFGIAKIVGEGKSKTATGSKMGTLHYMSPEQVKSAKDVDQRSDIYSLGVTLYEMATGRVPFNADSEYSMMDLIIGATPPPPSTIYPGVFPAFEQMILTAMAKEPLYRYQSAAEFLSALESLAVSPAVAPVSFPDRIPINRPAAPSRPGPISTPPPSSSKTVRNLLIAALVLLVILIGGVAVFFKFYFKPPMSGGPPVAVSTPGTGAVPAVPAPATTPPPVSPPPVTPPPPPPPPVPSTRGIPTPSYVIASAAVDSESAASKLTDNLRRQGYSADYLWIPDYASLSGAPKYLVYIGPYTSLSEAKWQLDTYKRRNSSAYGILVDTKPGRFTF